MPKVFKYIVTKNYYNFPRKCVWTSRTYKKYSKYSMAGGKEFYENISFAWKKLIVGNEKIL